MSFLPNPRHVLNFQTPHPDRARASHPSDLQRTQHSILRRPPSFGQQQQIQTNDRSLSKALERQAKEAVQGQCNHRRNQVLHLSQEYRSHFLQDCLFVVMEFSVGREFEGLKAY